MWFIVSGDLGPGPVYGDLGSTPSEFGLHGNILEQWKSTDVMRTVMSIITPVQRAGVSSGERCRSPPLQTSVQSRTLPLETK